LLGTARKSFTVPQVEGALGDLLSQLAPERGRTDANVEAKSAEKLLLDSAAVVTLYETCGQIPERIETVFPAACGLEIMPMCPGRTRHLFEQMLAEQHADVLPEALRLANVKGYRFFADLLPALLELGTKRTDLRDSITHVLGMRGQWLVRQNQAWEWAEAANTIDESALEGVWQTGSRDKRLRLLRELRRINPSRSRALVSSTWEEETPEDRVAFLRAFAINLGDADEFTLEAALDNRRKEVRHTAADLLARLPASALVRRMKERVQPLVSISTSGVLKRKMQLEVTLPADCDKAMQRDGVEPKPTHGIGEKAWWLMQMLSIVPPRVWCEKFGLSALEILQLARTHELKSALLGGWERAARRHRDALWVEALWAERVQAKSISYWGDYSTIGLVSEVLNPSRREEIIIGELDANKDFFRAREDGGQMCLRLLRQYRYPWSPKLTTAFINRARRSISIFPTNAEAFESLTDAALYISPEFAEEVARSFDEANRHEQMNSILEKLFSTLQFRRRLHECFEEVAP
jgi:hypothetical protein